MTTPRTSPGIPTGELTNSPRSPELADMSGFEIAGIVLAAFPILQDAAKGLRSRYKDVKTWWRFEREFEDFFSAIEREHIAFSQILEILLDPIVSLSDEKRETLQNDPRSRLWSDPQLQVELRHRVQRKYYDWFMRQMWDINDSLEKLHGLLPINKVRAARIKDQAVSLCFLPVLNSSQAYHLDSNSLESEMYRLKSSFSHEKDTLLSRIREKNQSVYEFLDRASHLSRTSTPIPSTRNNSKAASLFLEVQNQARSLYKCFQRHWVCSCSSHGSHQCCIMVQGSDLKVLFDYGNERTQVKVEVETTNPPSRPSLTPQLNKSDAVLNLGHQISVKSRLKKLKDKGQKGVFGLAASTISVFSSPVSLGEGQYEGMKRPQEKVIKS
jgi:hypothetical protein